MSSPMLARTLARRIPVAGTRVLHRGTVGYASYSSVHENDPQHLENHKRSSLEEQKAGKGQWREELASDAEAVIKAERKEIKATGEEIKKLEKETEELLKKAGLKG
ncbi:hypothetical protein ABW19_dt0209504 [Dactylella cylindrospora]|nr:hypothetical protein ABW19_dt0209504 [Dactylella cylindrospora]